MKAVRTLCPGRLEAAGFHIERLRYGIVDNLWARRGTRGAGVLLRRAHRCGADRPARGMEVDPFAPAVRDGVLYGRGRRGHEERSCRDGHRRRAVRRATSGSQGLDRLSHHQRRGRPLGRRHQAGHGNADRARRAHRLVRGRRAFEREGRSATRSRSVAAALSAAGSPCMACRATWPIRSSRKIRCIARAGAGGAGRRASGTRARSTSSRPLFRSRTSMPAPARPT